jgi:hypothetical protein
MISDLASKYPSVKAASLCQPPEEMISARSHASSILLIGTLSQGRDDIRRILLSGGRVPILLPDYRHPDLLEEVRDHYPGDVAVAEKMWANGFAVKYSYDGSRFEVS